MADLSDDFQVFQNNITLTMVNFHLSLAARIALTVYVCFLMFVGIIANSVFLLVIKRHPRIRRAVASVSLTYIMTINLVNCCLLNSFSLAAIFNDKTRQSVLYCKLYVMFSSIFMKMFALALITTSVVSNIEVVRWSTDKKRLRLGCKLALVASSLLVIGDSPILFYRVEISSDPTCFIIRDNDPIRMVWIVETLIIMILPLICCIVSLIMSIKKIREARSKVAAHPQKANSSAHKNVSSRKQTVEGTGLKNFTSVGASQSDLAESQTSPPFLPSCSKSTATTEEQYRDTGRGPSSAWAKPALQDNAPAVGDPETRNCLINLCRCQHFILGEEVRIMCLVFCLCLTLIISWTPSAVMIGGSLVNTPTFLNYILLRVSYLTTIHPSVIPLAFLYTNKHFKGGFVAFFRSLRNRKA